MGRDKKNENRTEKFTKMVLATMKSEAWQALPPVAQALYPWLKLEWKGSNHNNNGKLRLSVRQAADRLGVCRNTAANAFHHLQAKGFIVVTETAHLGFEGHGTSPAFELTELPKPPSREPKNLFRHWKPGHDFPVRKAAIHNPAGKRSKNPVIKFETARRKFCDE
jgi:DNA-binding transcriptional MocR family regulator